MSDLQCPATLLIARHGEAEHAAAGVLSDDGGRLTATGREQVARCAGQVRPRRIAAVYSSPMEPAVESARLAASELGLQPVVVDGLQEFGVGGLAGVSIHDARAQQVFNAWRSGDLDIGCPGAEDGHLVVRRFARAVGEIADMHRGEAVLVFAHGGAMSLAIPRLAANLGNNLAAQRFLPHCVPVEVEIDGDGWRVVTWPGATDEDIGSGRGSEQA
jgi:2,3-bisphosphoglycerate-dependent phosphoglycerate mutase